MRLVMTAALLTLFALPAQAQKWQYVGGNEKIRTYTDTDSVVREGDTASATVLSAFAVPIRGTYAFTLKIVYDCTQMRFRELDGEHYSATGSVIRADPGKEPDKYYETHPNGVDESGRQYACFGKGGMKAVQDPFADAGKEFGWKP